MQFMENVRKYGDINLWQQQKKELFSSRTKFSTFFTKFTAKSFTVKLLAIEMKKCFWINLSI